jgi:Ca2+-binding EF-hand superfamily protein
MSGRPPFRGDNFQEIMRSICSGAWSWESKYGVISDAALDFMKCCLQKEEEMFSAADALNHPWILNCRKFDVPDEAKMHLANTLKCFANAALIVKLLMEVTSFTLMPHQLKYNRQLFTQIDSNATAEITIMDFKNCMINFMSESELQDSFKALDYNNTSVITYHKFLAGATEICDLDEGNFAMAFEILTKGQQDFFTSKDLAGIFGDDVSLHDFEKALSAVGILPQDEINYERFKELMGSPSSSTKSARLTEPLTNRSAPNDSIILSFRDV